MAHKYELSRGVLETIMRGGEVDNPIIQVLACKKIVTGRSEKYRLLLGDGKYKFASAMTAAQKDSPHGMREINVYSILKIKKYVTSVINNSVKAAERRILVILDYETLVEGNLVNENIGDCIPLPNLDTACSDNQVSSSMDMKKEYEPPSDRKPTLLSSSSNVNLNVSLNEQLTLPISSLSPYQNKWIIKVRVTNKSQIRTWSNSRGEGKLFSIDLLDESGEIKATAFKEMVDKYYDFIQVDKVYYISKCQIKLANKQYSTIQNDYEMTFTNDTVVQECSEEENGVPKVKFDLVTIDKISQLEVGAVVDIIGVCKQASDIQTIVAKSTGKEIKKRELILVDMSKNSVSVTIWGLEAEQYDYDRPVIAIKGGRLNEFGGGKNITVPSSAMIKYNPDIPEAYSLRAWFDNGGEQEEMSNVSARTGSGNFVSPWMSLKEVKDSNMGQSAKGDYYQTKVTILLVKSENCFYKACPQENCNKKIVDMENGLYRCEKCNAEFPNFKYRLLGNMNVGDWSDNQWVSMFTSEAEKVLGKTSTEIGEAAERSEEEINAITSEANFKQYIFKCRAKMETYNDEARLKTVAVRVDPINYKEYNSYLISQIKELTG